MNFNINKYSVLIIFLISALAYSQNLIEKTGSVSYISSQNIYVKFENTLGILEGDTLYLRINNKLFPAIKVKFISSTSAAGEKIGVKNISQSDVIIAIINAVQGNEKSETDSLSSAGLKSIKKIEETNKTVLKDIVKSYKYSEPPVSGRISIQSYSGLSNYFSFGDYQRWRYNFSLYAKDILGSKISWANYISFSYKTSDWQSIKNNFAENLRVYDFAVNYQFTKNINIWLGRHLNSKITNISSIDGLQYESKIEKTKYSYGLVAGSRPAFADMGFNIKLFELGGYITRIDSASIDFMENTLALMQQTNDLKIDRRFLYFQHSSNLINNLNLFLSSEADLYKRVNGDGKNDFSLTGLYFSARYTPLKILSLLLSYDARKNVIYYETFKNFIETLIENEIRQGFRGGVYLKPFNKIFINLNTGYRYSKSDPKPSRNYNVYISYSQLPIVELTPSISFTKLVTSYVDGSTGEIRLTKDIDLINSNLSLSYERIDYSFSYSLEKLEQNVFSADLFISLLKKLYLTFDYEGTFQKSNTDSRIVIGLTQRF